MFLAVKVEIRDGARGTSVGSAFDACHEPLRRLDCTEYRRTLTHLALCSFLTARLARDVHVQAHSSSDSDYHALQLNHRGLCLRVCTATPTRVVSLNKCLQNVPQL